METTTLGNSGLMVSRICLGMMSYGDPAIWRKWVLREDEARPLVRRAFELGINFFDTADMYSKGESERITGKLLAELAPRDRHVIATKVYFPMSDDPNDRGLSRKHILAACENSLRRLNTDYIDLYYIHRWHYGTPIEETLEALHSLLRDGKVRYLGASSMYAFQLAKALYLADALGFSRFVAMQNHYNLLYREEEREMIPLCQEEGIGLVPWSPLARGYLAGGRFPDESRPTPRAQSDSYAHRLYNQPGDREVVATLHDLALRSGWSPDPNAKKSGKKGTKKSSAASARDTSQPGAEKSSTENSGGYRTVTDGPWTPSQIALAWLFRKAGVVAPIVGSTRVTHIEEAAAALELTLDNDTVAGLEAPYTPHPVAGHGKYGTEAYD